MRVRGAFFAAFLGWAVIPGLSEAQTPTAEDVVWGCDDAGYVLPTTEYKHAVLGDDVEYKGLFLLIHTATGVLPATLELPEGQVYEDIAPRCGDLDGDGDQEVVTVISDAKVGARLAVYDKQRGPIDETPPIGRGYRWLAPIGIADVNGDGQNDVAYVETPHIGGALRVWTLLDGKLTEIANAGGFSNHRIGEDFITGGMRDCGSGTEMIVPSFDWAELLSVRMEGPRLVRRTISADTDLTTVESALNCEID
ncbi:MAG: VCBS repeat-containing protein [Pseudomonadota bacterium]